MSQLPTKVELVEDGTVASISPVEAEIITRTFHFQRFPIHVFQHQCASFGDHKVSASTLIRLGKMDGQWVTSELVEFKDPVTLDELKATAIAMGVANTDIAPAMGTVAAAERARQIGQDYLDALDMHVSGPKLKKLSVRGDIAYDM